MSHAPRAVAVLALGPFADEALAALPHGTPAWALRLPMARSRAGHDWLPATLRGVDAPSLRDSRPGRRLDLLAGGRAALATLGPERRAFVSAAQREGRTPVLVVLCALFDAEAAGLLDLLALLGAEQGEERVLIEALCPLTPPDGSPEPLFAARASLALTELDAATVSDWELPAPGGVLAGRQRGVPGEGARLLLPAGKGWTRAEAVQAVVETLAALPSLPPLPGPLAASRVVAVRAPSVDLRERLADRLVAAAVDRWLEPAPAQAEALVARVLAGRPSAAPSSWVDAVLRRADALVADATALHKDDAEASGNLLRGAVPALERDLHAEIAAGGALRRSAEEAVRRWQAGARAEALAVVGELLAEPRGGGHRVVALVQEGPDLAGQLRQRIDEEASGIDLGASRIGLERATESLRLAIDKPPALTVRLLDRKGERVLRPLAEWRGALAAWVAALALQTTLREEARTVGALAHHVGLAGVAVQTFEMAARQAAGALRQAARAANQGPALGVVIMPGGAVDPEEAADRLEALAGVPDAVGFAPTAQELAGDPAPAMLRLRDRLRTRLGPAEARLTLAGALASLPADGPARAALLHTTQSAAAPLSGPAPGEANEQLIALLPRDVDPAALALPEGTLIVAVARSVDALLVRVAGPLRAARLGLRKAALDEGLTRLAQREPNHPDLRWKRV